MLIMLCFLVTSGKEFPLSSYVYVFEEKIHSWYIALAMWGMEAMDNIEHGQLQCLGIQDWEFFTIATRSIFCHKLTALVAVHTIP